MIVNKRSYIQKGLFKKGTDPEWLKVYNGEFYNFVNIGKLYLDRECKSKRVKIKIVIEDLTEEFK